LAHSLKDTDVVDKHHNKISETESFIWLHTKIPAYRPKDLELNCSMADPFSSSY